MTAKNTKDIDILLDELKDTKKFGAMIPIEAPSPTEQPELTDENINTWKNGIARTLKQFVIDGTQAADKKCGACGDPEGLIYEEGCLKCKNCGDTKCG